MLERRAFRWALMVLALGVASCADGVGPVPQNVLVDVAAGGLHSCGLRWDGVAFCWGRGTNLQLGSILTDSLFQALPYEGPDRFSFLSAGYMHTCGLNVAGPTVCWGWNHFGELGDGTYGTGGKAVVAGGHEFVDVSAGWFHTCAVDGDGAAYCWGLNSDGQLGDGTTVTSPVPVRVATTLRLVSIAAGGFHTCGLTADGQAVCWGRGADGQLGDGTVASHHTPVTVSGPFRFEMLAAGNAHTCGLDADGALYCWGSNSRGQLGTGATPLPALPGAVAPEPVTLPGVQVTGITAGADFTCAVAVDGTGYCWGAGERGQLGDGDASDRSAPARIEDVRFDRITAGSGTHACGLDRAGRTFCWGTGEFGQLGAQGVKYSAVPVQVQFQ